MAQGVSSGFDAHSIRHFKKLIHLLPLLSSLRDSGCERDKAGNRDLHFDQYVTLVLLYLFNPLIDSMRTLQEASLTEKVAAQLGIKRFSLGSFSESVRVFEPEKLRAVMEQLAGELRPLRSDPRLKDHLQHVLTLVDGTVLNALSTLAASWFRNYGDSPKHAWRLHTYFDFAAGVPTDVELTDARNSGKSDEKYVLRSKLRKDHCYVMDRGFAQFTLFNDIDRTGSSYVCRVKENSVFKVLQERALDQEGRQAGLLQDAVVKLGVNPSCSIAPDHPVRILVIKATPHVKRGGHKGKGSGPGNEGTLVLATNLLEAPAHLIALIYQFRWSIEIFFRFFKQLLGCRHLLSQRIEGIQIQVYCAVIACMLINLWTDRKPGKQMVNMLAWYFMGIASETDVQTFLKRPDRTGIKKKAKDELWKKLGVN
jgi:Transposase DDE domain